MISSFALCRDIFWDELNAQEVQNKNPFRPCLPVSSKKMLQDVPADTTLKKDIKVKEVKPILSPRPSDLDQKILSSHLSKFIVTGLVWNSERPQAIINGVIVNVGDKIKVDKTPDVDIVSIKKEGIDIIFNGVKATLKP